VVLCVAYPHMAGIGGDGFWLVAAPGEAVTAINASGPSAQGATRELYRSLGHEEAIPARGPLAALTVPGAVDGWRLAHEAHGRLEWGSLFRDGIGLADRGVPVGRSLADWSAADADLLGEHAEAASIFVPGGLAPREGDRLVQADLARTLQVIAEDGARAGLYDGPLGERLVAGVASSGSPLSTQDLSAYRAEWVDPITTTYRGLTVHQLPPNTQGFAALQLLNLLEGYDVTAWGDGSAAYHHHVAEAVKLAFADRDEWLTDHRYVDIPLDRLLAKSYADERRSLIDPDRAMVMEEVEPGIPYGEHVRKDVGGDTCAFQVIDGEGLAVSVIQSIYHDFGSACVPPGTGVILQNRGSFFSLEDDHPNRLEPGKRTFHTLIPAMLTRDGRVELAYGTMGGEGQPQTQAAIVTRLVDFGYDVQQAIEAPRWLMGRTWGVTSRDLSLESRVAPEVVRELERRGQPVKLLGPWDDNTGHASAIRVDHERGFLEGGADPRGDGSAAGF
ncbi:MAG: gamma-glutamyltransferase, partial [Actinomycetota bacterium]|nr:gamma-glutamyltransferase [Actinomycetota bacterium]